MSELLRKASVHILNPLILFGFGVALLYFIWGIFRFLANEDNEEERRKSKQSMLWGVIGMVIMVSVYGLISIILQTFGIPAPNIIRGKV